MIYTYPIDHPAAPPTGISVDSGKSFDLSEAKRILDLSRSGHLTITYTGENWWTQPQVGKLFDFLSYRGASLIHLVGEHDASHNAYLSTRLEKLYTDDILDNWAQV